MLRRPPRSTRTDTLFPYTTLFRSSVKVCCSSVPFGITELLMAAPLPYPALVASHAGNWIAFPGGETRAVGRGEGIARAADTPVILLNAPLTARSEEHTSELQSLMRLSYAVFCLKKKN